MINISKIPNITPKAFHMLFFESFLSKTKTAGNVLIQNISKCLRMKIDFTRLSRIDKNDLTRHH